MKNVFMKIFLVLLNVVLLIPLKVDALSKVTCGDEVILPKQLPNITNFFINIILVVTPIVLIVMGMIDLAKGVIGSDEEKIKKGRKTFFKRIISALCVFFVVLIVKFVVNVIDGENRASALDCVNCFLNGEDKCTPYVEPVEETGNNNYGSKSNSTSEDNEKSSDKGTTTNIQTNSSTNKSTGSTKKNTKSTKNYKKIFIGDSRTVDMCETYSLCEENQYIAKVGAGYSWFSKSAVPSATSKTKTENYNIIILMGVNDIGKTESSGSSVADKYYNRIYDLATSNWKNHKIIYVSINPVIDGHSNAYMAAVSGFNNRMKSQINNSKLSNLKYCNTSSSLDITKKNSPDGLHYNKNISKQIYDKIINSCI